jgi:primosomal protein N''
MALLATPNEPYLRGFAKLAGGPLSRDTSRWLFRQFDPDLFRALFQRFVASFSEQRQGVVAIKSKVVRDSLPRA